tara:strand:+ start:22 stop:324 length:303 start_codon:yes stop_codon:yes gene_type:complete
MDKRFNIHDWQAKQRKKLNEHHAGDYKPGFLKQSVSTFLDKLKKKNEADYNKVEKIMEKHFSAKKEVEEISTTGGGAAMGITGPSMAHTDSRYAKKQKRK